jgi:DNA ligase (NAD+)
MPTNPKSRILSLRTEIREHDELYDLNKPKISDQEYNQLYYELVDLEKQCPELFDANSPTQRIYTMMIDELEKVRHTSFMGSQEKIHTFEELVQFANRYNSPILLQYKLDGLTVVLTYEKGLLIQAVTRGDGEIGENVIHTVRTIQNIPQRIEFQGRLEIRIEGIMPYADFERINVNGDYSNCRNLVSGTLRQLNAKFAKERNVQGIAFELIEIEGVTFQTISEQLAFLTGQGFTVVETELFLTDEAGLKRLQSFLETMETVTRGSLDYMIDGMIGKFDSLRAKEELGNTAKCPRWSIAYKFEALEATTRIKHVLHSVARTGQITPVYYFDMVTIADVDIECASAANYEIIEAKDIRIGDKVVVIRANDVIPKVEMSIKEERTGEEIIIVAPTECPACGTPTIKKGAHIFCRGTNCMPQIKGMIEFFASRRTLNIDSLGEKTIDLFVENGFIRTFIDLFDLEDKKDELCKLEGFAIKSFTKLQNELEKAKSAPFHKALHALSIPLIGGTKSKELSKVFASMDEMMDASLNAPAFHTKLISIPDIGEAMADSLVGYFTNDENRRTIEKMKEIGFTMISEFAGTPAPTGDSLVGKIFVITGTFTSGNRDHMTALVEAHGGKASGSVSKKTSFLLFGADEAGSGKHNKAIELGTPILTEDEFLTMIGEKTA